MRRTRGIGRDQTLVLNWTPETARRIARFATRAICIRVGGPVSNSSTKCFSSSWKWLLWDLQYVGLLFSLVRQRFASKARQMCSGRLSGGRPYSSATVAPAAAERWLGEIVCCSLRTGRGFGSVMWEQNFE